MVHLRTYWIYGILDIWQIPNPKYVSNFCLLCRVQVSVGRVSCVGRVSRVGGRGSSFPINQKVLSSQLRIWRTSNQQQAQKVRSATRVPTKEGRQETPRPTRRRALPETATSRPADPIPQIVRSVGFGFGFGVVSYVASSKFKVRTYYFSILRVSTLFMV